MNPAAAPTAAQSGALAGRAKQPSLSERVSRANAARLGGARQTPGSGMGVTAATAWLQAGWEQLEKGQSAAREFAEEAHRRRAAPRPFFSPPQETASQGDAHDYPLVGF